MRGINLEILSSFNLMTTTSILQSDKESMSERENQRISVRTDLEVLSSFDFIIATSTNDSQYM